VVLSCASSSVALVDARMVWAVPFLCALQLPRAAGAFPSTSRLFINVLKDYDNAGDRLLLQY
jgi:hypothetical protein